ncbi:MAG: ABC transporter permease [Anaerolineales bacterium]
MKKTLLVLKHEIITILSRPSFLFAMFGIPIIGVLVFVIAGQWNKGSSTQALWTQLISSSPTVMAEGYVDQSGIIKGIPANVQPGLLVAFPDEASAKQALSKNEISAYYIIPSDYIQTGKITYVRPDYVPIGTAGQAPLLEWVLQVNLLGGNTELASLINGPKNLQQVSLSPEPQRDENNMLTFFLPYGVTMLFYIIILSAASLLLSSVAKEKENQVIEILMMSVTPRQLLTGKIVGLGLLGLLQTIAWVGTGRVLLALSGTTFNIPIVFQLPPSFLVWALIFFMLGYSVYASLMAGLGALVPNLREASQATILVIFPLIIPIFLLSVLIEQPHSLLATILSIFPLTAPVAMMTRLASGGVPFWQTLLAAVLLALTAILVVRSVARMFHAQAILSGQPFSRKVFFDALLGKS